jgi:hypothetical protein
LNLTPDEEHNSQEQLPLAGTVDNFIKLWHIAQGNIPSGEGV